MKQAVSINRNKHRNRQIQLIAINMKQTVSINRNKHETDRNSINRNKHEIDRFN